jgi:hypothetical protein
MYVNWRALVVLAVLAVAGWYAYDTFVAGGEKRAKMPTADLLATYEASSTVDRELTYAELKGRAEKPGALDASALRTWLGKKGQAPETYKVAAEMLGRIQDRKSVDTLVKDLQDSKPSTRIGAARYFQHAPARRAFDPLVKNLDHDDPDVRKECVVSLESLAARTTAGVRYKAEPTKWKEWWDSLSKGEKNKIPE